MTSSTLAVGFALAWKSFAVTGAAAVIALSMRRASAAARHMVWALALAGVLALPALVLLVPPRPVTMPTYSLTSRWLRFPSPTGSRAAGGHATPAIAAPTTSAVSTPRAEALERVSRAADPAPTAGGGPPVWIVLWIAGALIVLARIAFGYLLLQRSVHRANPITSGPWRSLLRRLASIVGLETPPALLRVPSTTMPMTWGLMRPAVLLPEGADTWPEARREIVLLHELAHVRRRDCLTQALGQVACALYWFNPLVWIAARRLRAERELACDDLVLRHGAAGPTYAAELLELARTLRDARGAALATVAMARRSQLEGRLLAILNPAQNRATVGRPLSALLATALLVMLVPVAAVVPVSGAVVPDPLDGTRPVMERLPAPPARPAQPPSATPAPRPAPDTTSSVAAVQTSTSAVDALVGALDDPDAQVRRTAAVALARLRDRRALPGLTAALKDESPEVRRAAAGALGDLRDQQAVDALIGALKDTEPDVRRAAASSLADLRDPRAVEPLVAALGDDNADVRRFAASALGDLRDVRAVPALVAKLKDDEAEVRRFAASALGDLRDRRAVPALITALSDANADVRCFAAFALGDIRDPAAAGPLATAMKDADPEVRRAAISALADLAKSDDGADPNPNPRIKPGGGSGTGSGVGVGIGVGAGPATGRSVRESFTGGIAEGILQSLVRGIPDGITGGIVEGIREGIVEGVRGGIPGGVRGGVPGGVRGGTEADVHGGITGGLVRRQRPAL